MRSVFFGLFLLLVGESTVHAAEGSAERSLINLASVVVDMRKDERAYCAKPRINTPAQCHKDFENAIDKTVALSAQQILYYRASESGSRPEDVARLYVEWQKIRKDCLETVRAIENAYYPPPATGQAPAAPKPVSLNTKR